MIHICISKNNFIIEKLERKKKQLQTKKDIALFTKERANLFSKMNEATAMFDETFKITMKQNLKDDSADEIEAKVYTTI